MRIAHAAARVTILTRSTIPAAACPLCGAASRRVHGRYDRVLADVQRHLGLALGGEPGARLAARLAMPTSGDTLLRLVRAVAVRPPTPARVLGVDDRAWRRGQSYGTILCDLERREVIDLLPDREAMTLAAWLRRRPGTEVVARDRAGAYADGIRRGAPGAQQVADRWHLLRNCSEALQNVLGRNRVRFREAARAVTTEAASNVSAPPRRPTKLELHQRRRQADRNVGFEEVVGLARAGLGIRAITHETGLARNTVRRWLRDGVAPTWRKGERPGITDPFMPYLRQRIDEGCRNATRLWHEIHDRGYVGKVITVRACVRRLKADDPAARAPRPRVSVWRRPTPRRVARMMLADARPSGMNARFLTALCATSKEIAYAAALARAFVSMVRDRAAASLGNWLEAAGGGPLGGFAEGLRRDRAAVAAALTLPWSTGPVEGKITKLKLVKRSMYGRGGIDLLKQRLLAA